MKTPTRPHPDASLTGLEALRRAAGLGTAATEAERTLLALINCLPGMIYCCRNDRDWTMLYVSEGCAELTGHATEDLVGNRRIAYADLIHPEDREQVWREVQEAVADGRRFRLVYRIRTASGDVRWVWEQGHGIHDADGALVALEGFVTDITERKTAEEALRQAELRYRSIFDNAVHGIYQSTPEGRFLNVNGALARMLGYDSPEQLISECRSIADDYYADPSARDEFTRTMRERGRVSGFECRVRRRDGRLIWTRESYYAVRDAGGRVLFYEGSVEDVTERKEAELALRESEERYRRLFADASEIIYTTDLSGNYTSLNRAGERLTGYTEEEVRGLNFRDIVEPECLPLVEQMLARKVRGGETTTCYETEMRTKSGERISLEVSTQLMRDSAGRPAGVQGIARDITGRKRAEAALRESEERYRQLFDNSPHPMWIYEPATLRFLAVNESAVRHYGYAREEFLRMTIRDIRPPDEVPALIERLMSPGEASVVTAPRMHRKKDGTLISVEISAHKLFVGGRECRVVLAHDVTQRVRAEDALRESEERYRELLENANDIVYTHDLRGNFTSLNKTGERVTGYTREEACAMNIASVVVPEHLPLARQMLTRKGGAESTRYELEITAKDGRRVPLEISTRLIMQDGAAVGVQGIARDITERRQADERLRHIAFHDTLTGLPNRALFTEHLRRAVESARRDPARLFAVLFLDLDRFKVINDSLGHTVGDQMLVALARRLENCLRANDSVARLGGDEFAILLNAIDCAADATRVAERIQQELAHPFTLSGHEVFAYGSIGIALSTTGYANEEDILRDADTVMYRAKALGRPYEVFDSAMHARVVSQMRLENDLRRAVERREFRVFYQPIVSLSTGRITGLEALARWQHPERGLIAPGEFIPVAEEMGLIVSVGQQVIEEACRRMSAWHGLSPLHAGLKLSVNLSGRQFAQPDLFERIERVVAATGLDPRCLQLEITESVVMENARTITAMIDELRELGVELAIDDFGTGYSSLAYLHRFPVKTLKIDRSFIGRTGGDRAGDDEIVRTIILLARNMGKDVVAEGVETAEQLARLRQLGCAYGQGYLFARPQDAAATEKLLRKGVESGLFLMPADAAQAAWETAVYDTDWFGS
ncbi:MAG TPA: PAS domain S-box protein [Pyrinomonadaceae bacterium]|nr:PAS domain S-box protein [Pyrinomonadaceae bacterium]